jgi:hypothetical protein
MSNTYPNGGNIYPNPSSGGGGSGGATSLVVTSGDDTIVQNGSSSYDSGTQTLSVDLSAVGGGSVTPQDIQNQAFTYAVDTGSADNYVITPDPAVGSLVTGMQFEVLIANSNLTTSPFITVGTTGAKAIILTNQESVATGDLVTNGISYLVYDGAVFQLINPATSIALTSHSAIMTFNQLTDSPPNATYAFSAFGQNGLFLVCTPEADGTGVLSYTLNNGRTWITGTPINALGVDLVGIVYGNGVWVIVGGDGTYAYSTDLVTWSNYFPDTGITSINDITFGAGYFVAVGNTGQSTVSADGNNWIPVSLPTADDYNNVCFVSNFFGTNGAPLFLAVSLASGNTAQSVTNAGTWQASSTLPITTYTSAKMCASPNIVLLIDTSGSPTTSYMYFDYNTVWTDGSSNPLPSSEVWTGAAYDAINRVFLLLTSDGFSTAGAQGLVSEPDSATYTLTWNSITAPVAAKWVTPVYGNFGFMSNNTAGTQNAYFTFWGYAPQVIGEAGNNQIVTQNDLAIGLNQFEKEIINEGIGANPVTQLIALMNDLNYTTGTNQALLFDTIVGSGIPHLYDGVNGTFTLPFNGIYSIQFQGLATTGTVSNVRLVVLPVNGTFAYSIPIANQGGSDTGIINSTVSFPEGGQFQVQFDATGSGNWIAGTGGLNLYTTNCTVTFLG